MSVGRSVALATRRYAAKPSLLPSGAGRPLCILCRSTTLRLPLSQPGLALSRPLLRPLHTSLKLGKERYNPHVDLGRFQTGGKRKYNLWKLETYREAYHENPGQFFVWALMVGLSAALLAWGAAWVYYTIIIRTHKYPDEVAAHLRQALWAQHKGDMKECIESYQRAILATEVVGMDPLSDEVTGLKIWYGELAEKAKVYDKAVAYLEKVRKEMLEMIEQRAEELGTVGKLRGMKRVIGVAVKIGDILQKDSGKEVEAEKVLEWSVAETLRMQQLQLGLKEGEEQPWKDEEFAAVLENMASFYEKRNNFEYATTLYLKAADIFKSPSCHLVVLMNNVGACNMQRPLPASEPMDRATQLEAAKKWLVRALDISGGIQKPVRTEECDTGCVVALHNIGEIEEQLGRLDEAKLKYSEAESLSWSVQYLDGYQNAGFALQRIQEKQAGTYDKRKAQEAEEKRKKEEQKLTPGGLPAITFGKR